jgi:DegV family protein with EDD domain
LNMAGKTWLDRVDIDPPAFYELLQKSLGFPTTSQPSASSFERLFVELSERMEGIAAILVSDDLSGTLDSARAAKANVPETPVELIDSRGVSMTLGFPVLAAAREAAAEGDLQAVANAARALIGKTHVYFIVDTLEYLHRGGRIGAAAKLLGSALNLKPILEIRDGIVKPVARVRTRSKALARVNELLQAQLEETDSIHMAVINIAAPEEAACLKAQLETRFHPVELIETECSPVLGAHAGPGTVAVAFYVE